MGIATKAISSIANSGFMRKNISKSITNSQFASRLLLVTSVAKDVFSYTLRIKNAKNNEEIPEDKKPFVVQMDRATRLVTALVQLSVGFLVSSNKFQNFFSSKLFKNALNNPELTENLKKSFASLSTLVVSTLLAKRLVVPLLATPLAGSFIKRNARDEKELEQGRNYISKKLYADSLTQMHFAFKARE